MDHQASVLPMLVSSVHAAPLSVEVQMKPPLSPAASFVPSSEDEMDLHAILPGSVVSSVHATPLSVEVQILPPIAASFVPSPEDVMENQ
jgi:hypothetical protein